MTTAVVAQTKLRALEIAHALGLTDTLMFFEACNHAVMEGVRADRWLIDAATSVSNATLSVIAGTALAMPYGGAPVRFVTVEPVPRGVSATNVAVVAATKAQAQLLADALGIKTRWIFGARTVAQTILGLPADRVLIAADTTLSTDALASIVCTVRKTPGGLIRYVTAWLPPELGT